MIALRETPHGFVVTDLGRKPRGRWVFVVAGALLALGGGVFLLPAQRVIFECDRARGTCTAMAWSAPVALVRRARLLSDESGGGRGAPAMHLVTFALELTNGGDFSLCTAPRDHPAAQQLQADVDRTNTFLATPSAPNLKLECEEYIRSTGERIFYPSGFATPLALVLLFWLAGWFSPDRIEFDGAGRQVKIRRRRADGGRRDIAASDVEQVEIDGRRLNLCLRSGTSLLLGVAATDAEVEALRRLKARAEAWLANL